MGLSDFLGQVAAGKGMEAINREQARVSKNVEREVDRVGQSVGREADKVVGAVEDAAAAVRGGVEKGVAAAHSLGHKVEGVAHSAANLGKKYSGEINSIAKKVEVGADVASAALTGMAAVAGASGMGAPVGAALGAAAGVAKGVGSAAGSVAGFTGKVNRGIDRAETMVRMGNKTLQGGISQGANTLNRGLDVAELRSGAARSGIERVKKDASGTIKAQFGGLKGL